MGKFSDLWATGKFIKRDREASVRRQEQDAVSLMQDFSPEIAVPESTKVIFEALRSRRSQETGRWLNNLATASSDSLEPLVTSAPPANLNAFEDVVMSINLLFKEFGDLAYEFNKTAVGSDLMISHDAPTILEKKNDDVWYRPVTKSYQGRLTTRQWALLVRGEDKKISVFLLPAAMVLAFTAGADADNQYRPFMEFVRSPEKGSWTIGGEEISLTTVPNLAKELLGDLVRVSSGVMSESELFSKNSDKPKLGQNMAVGYAVPPSVQTERQAPSNIDEQDLSVHDACDLVDAALNRELNRLYSQASALKADAAGAEVLRKQISAVQAFRTKITDAFEDFTHAAITLSGNEPEKSAQFELLH
jgi:hypothetical protein